jgi:hypothetical protein
LNTDTVRADNLRIAAVPKLKEFNSLNLKHQEFNNSAIAERNHNEECIFCSAGWMDANALDRAVFLIHERRGRGKLDLQTPKAIHFFEKIRPSYPNF